MKKLPRLSSKAAQPFKGVVIALADISRCTKVPKTTIWKWIRASGAKLAPKVGPSVTHLVCSRKYFESKGEAVAQEFDKVKIVAWEWLERSFFQKNKICVEIFLLRKLVAAAKGEKVARALRRRIQISDRADKITSSRAKHIVENTEYLRTQGYDIAIDSYGAACNVQLVKNDEEEHQSSRVVLRMCQSISLPRYYGAYAVYEVPERGKWCEILRYAPSQFHEVYPIFRDFFKEKTGLEWTSRPAPNLQPGGAFWGFTYDQTEIN